MKRIFGITTAALLGASMFAAPALAIDLGASAGTSGAGVQADASGAVNTGKSGGDPVVEGQTDMDAGANTTMPDVDAGTTAAIDTTFDSALTAIDGSATTTQAISTMTEVQEVRVVSVSDLEGHDAAAVERAVAENDADVDGLRTAIEANAAVSQELQAQGVDSSSIVAAQVGADGAVTIFVN
jgi:hypothetical protein